MGIFSALAADAGNTISGIDWSTIVNASTFQPLVNGIISMVPVVIAVTVPLLVIRKGWDFLKGNIYSA